VHIAINSERVGRALGLGGERLTASIMSDELRRLSLAANCLVWNCSRTREEQETRSTSALAEEHLGAVDHTWL
jgi:ribosomal protein S7